MPFLIKYCAGVPGVADNIINDENFETVRTSSLENLFSVLSTDRSSAFVVKKYLDENKDKAENIFVFWLAYLRDIILMQSQASNMIINIDKKDTIRQLAAKYDTDYLMNMSKRVIKAKNMLARYVSLKAISLWLSLKSA